MRRALVVCLLALSAACSRNAATSDPATAPLPETKAAPEPPKTDRWTCGADADCVLSCAYGAVNRAWADANIKQECDDGCASKGIVARCEAGGCVAFRDGARYDGCSKLAPDAPKKGM